MLGTAEEVKTSSYMTFSYGHASAGQPAKTYLHQLYADTGCRLEDLPRAMMRESKESVF